MVRSILSEIKLLLCYVIALGIALKLVSADSEGAWKAALPRRMCYRYQTKTRKWTDRPAVSQDLMYTGKTWERWVKH